MFSITMLTIFHKKQKTTLQYSQNDILKLLCKHETNRKQSVLTTLSLVKTITSEHEPALVFDLVLFNVGFMVFQSLLLLLLLLVCFIFIDFLELE